MRLAVAHFDTLFISSFNAYNERRPDTLGLGTAPGLDSHGLFEIDGSITRQDIHFGNNANFLRQRWDEYNAIAQKNGGQFGIETNAQDNVGVCPQNDFRYCQSRHK